jgi:hypothetical protein
MGSTFVARRAGIQNAAKATVIISKAAPISCNGVTRPDLKKLAAGRPALGLRKRTGQVEEFDLFFTHYHKLHLIKPKTDNNKINDIWAFGCAEND